MCVGSSGSRDLDEGLTDANLGCESRVALEIEIRRELVRFLSPRA